MDEAHIANLIARSQFGFTISMHIVLAALSIGLANYLMVLEGLWIWRKRQTYIDLYNYWLKIFALTVAVGVVSGVLMEYQFGTNWSAFATKTGAVVGPMMMYEVVVAFFLESGFIGVMLYGMSKVGKRLHFAATACVALGSLFSAFWILSANSWMQTPAGYSIGKDGRFVPINWWAIVFNPSFPYRFAHMTLAAFLATAFLVGGVGAWHLLRNHRNPHARLMLSMALWMATFVAPLQLLVGDQHGENTLAYQQQKVAAIEGAWDPRRPGSGQPLVLFAVPDMKERTNHLELAIPRAASLYLRHNLTGTISSLKEFPPADIPPAPIIFFAFRVMVGLGLLMIAVGIASVVLRRRRSLYDARWLLHTMVALSPAGFVAMLAGWVVTEVGRQPYTVYGLLRTINGSSPIPLRAVAWSAASIVAVYAVVFGIGFVYLLRIVAKPPHAKESGPHPTLASEMSGGRRSSDSGRP
ncbi:cytochrome ubiquinol oxidase subunit I [Pararobbsia alpina]|uniref:Cytochrome bd-II ubiquinol oxidase subunit 1 n=1 Tax=Pararobbsia alpina TaxID=621374 RepID=A0A6S7BID4_9BURK|nr:cytochrome ubiquinol oxidase subunit I [Pararobbsia alpina]CAB3801160.1 Cytochrome bd-II ubiquinol oxidase subunit 1 [Pararobbsia alpina]